MKTTTESSPYFGLVNLCYQLRHENEELLETEARKSELVHACEKEIEILKTQLSQLDAEFSNENEESLAEKISMGNDRLILMQENSRMETDMRSAHLKIQQLQYELAATRDQVDILRQRVELASVVADVAPVSWRDEDEERIKKLQVENKRLRDELETTQFIHDQINSKKRRTEIFEDVAKECVMASTVSPVQSTAVPAVEPTYIMSADSSLLRIYESIIGYSMVKTDDIVTLIPNWGSERRIKFKLFDNGNLELVLEEVDESALAILRTFNSVPGFIAKTTLVHMFEKIIN